MSKILRNITLFCLPLFTLVLGWQLGVRFEQKQLDTQMQQLNTVYSGGTGSGQTIADPQKDVDMTLFWNVWKLLLDHYITPAQLNPTTMLFGAVHGLVQSIGDPYTVFMTPEENIGFRDTLDGHLEGIGAELSMQSGKITVVEPLKDSPAQKAGLLPGDVIIQVDGVSMDGKTLQDVVAKIRGKSGTSVTILVERKDAKSPLSFTIVRASVQVPSVESEIKKTTTGSVAYVAIRQFGGDTIVELTSALKELKKSEKDLKGLILDLRYNGGGYLDGAVDLTSLFLQEGKVVTVEGRNAEPQRHYVSGQTLFPKIPIVVLINEGTASASEIVAGALQDHKRATIIGTKSFGKGTVQEVIDLPGGSSLRVTIAHWLTPNGKNLGKEGVMPDIYIERPEQPVMDKDHDPQMLAALEWLLDHRDITGGKKPVTASGAQKTE